MTDLSIENASAINQAKTITKIENAVMAKERQILKSNGEQILNLIKSASISSDPDVGNNVDTMVWR